MAGWTERSPPKAEMKVPPTVGMLVVKKVIGRVPVKAWRMAKTREPQMVDWMDLRRSVQSMDPGTVLSMASMTPVQTATAKD